MFIQIVVYQRRSPQKRPRGHILKVLLALKLKSLALVSKPRSPRKYPVLGSGTVLFFNWLKRNITKQKIDLNF